MIASLLPASRRARVSLAVAAALAVVVLLVWLDGGFAYWQHCVDQSANYYSGQPDQKDLSLARLTVKANMHCVGAVLSDNDKPIIALFTIVLGIAAVATWLEVRASAQRQLRAYISVGWKGLYGGGLIPGSFEVLATNHGQTPALRASVSTQMRVLLMSVVDEFDFPELLDGDPTGDLVVHNGTPRSVTSRAIDPPISEGAWAAVAHGDAGDNRPVRLYCWGVARYTDVFGKRRWTRYCWYYGGEYSYDRKGWSHGRAAMCHRHNDTSDAPDPTLPPPNDIQPGLLPGGVTAKQVKGGPEEADAAPVEPESPSL